MSRYIYVLDHLNSHSYTVALPCYHPIAKRAKRPKNPCYPKELTTLGDHIRKKRLDLNLFQKDVAKKLHTTTNTVTNWEKNRCQPVLKFYPAIMEFLGYCPILYPKTLGERLGLYRIHQGLSFKKLAQMMKVDPGALSKQMKKKEPSEYFRELIDIFYKKA